MLFLTDAQNLKNIQSAKCHNITYNQFFLNHGSELNLTLWFYFQFCNSYPLIIAAHMLLQAKGSSKVSEERSYTPTECTFIT